MLPKKINRYLGALVLLFAFFINSVPVVFVHQVFSNHHHEQKSTTQKKDGEDKKQISSKINCGCEKLFTETLFTSTSGSVLFQYSFIFPLQEKPADQSNVFQLFAKNYRGPPVALYC